ncbi:type II toxin-antitoxin system Phd/YefM family antitoxin [Streptomyces uncialis]|uniref:type II toxin-antitoxin system Phd/YefM family antitoxin n=1 Tax=Streptomyces uncialis TaxID=1048205 RepID=UPI00340F73A3
MEVTAREFSRRSSQILAAVARGETLTVTKNGVASLAWYPSTTAFPRTPRTSWAKSICPTSASLI